MNWAGTECVDEKQSWLENNHIGEGGPTTAQMMAAIEAILDPENQTNINEMAGWNFLTSPERESLLQYLGSLGHAVDRTQLTVYTGPEMTTDERIQRIKEEQNRLQQIRELMINQLNEEIKERRDIQNTIINAIAGDSKIAPYLLDLLKIPEWILKMDQSAMDFATKYVEGKLTKAVKVRILQEAYGNSPPTLAAAAAELIKQIPQMATQGCVGDYYLYLKYFKENCGANCNGDDADLAHEMALEKLQDNIASGRKDWSKPGQAYDNAFRKLNEDIPKKDSP